MKKLQNYLMKPQELRKKLDNPNFRRDFIEWNKSNISISRQNQSRHSRSKSPVQKIQKSLQLNPKKPPIKLLRQNRQNIRPRSSSSKPVNKPNPFTIKHDRNKSDHMIKRQISNTFLAGQKPLQQKNIASEYLSTKNRYNSCKNIDYSKRQKQRISITKTKDKKFPKLRYGYRTKQGVQITNPNKTNQDSLIIKTNLGDKNMNLFAVADGHGLFGHLVSQFIVKNITKSFENELRNNSLGESIPKVFDKIQKSLSSSEINPSCSGSTLVSVVLDKDEVICANVGDSRAILARQIDRKSWQLIYLSQDHKPSVESQKKRIIKHGGRVHAFRDQKNHPVGPLRVWLPNQNIQGLAMTRSFGDNISKPLGVTHQPQLISIKIDKRDKFILLASDGVWQFLSNHEVLQLIVPYYKQDKLEQACDALLKLAYQRWTVQDCSVVDDITFILIFLHE